MVTAGSGLASLSTSTSTGLATATSSISSLSTTVNTINDKGTKYFHANSTAADSVASGQEAVAIGPQSVASGASSFAAGNGARATADGAVAVGFGAQATGVNAIAIGTGALATGSQAIGANSRAGGGGVALGDGADAGGTVLSQAQTVSKGTAIGFGAIVQQSGGVALGSGAVADRAGMNGQTEAISGVAVSSTAGAVSVGSVGNERQITNVAGGTKPTDAVNLRQLETVQAGGVRYDVNPDGSVNYNQMTLGNGQAPNGTRISNVAPGILPTDAANVGQLNAMQYQLQGQIASTQRIAYSGVAMATAMSTLPQAMTPGKSLMSVGVGNYSGYSALAIGYSSRSNDGKWVYKINGSYSGQKFNIGVGVGYEFD
ncbi:YadA-like family protein [Variovorax sp. ZS18.2.2]|uniref:YadA-like family protein n=1 Tax=Variovorax sp. ZS18.2.2 TaxID=2971255 RepID=UPI0035B4B7D5